MQQAFDAIKSVLLSYWGNYAYQGMFYISLIAILTIEKDKIKRHMYTTYALLIMLVIMNPITVYIMKLFFGESYYKSYYPRLFASMPLICIIAYGFTLLIKNLEGMKKLCLVGLLLMMVAMGGNNIYSTEWMQKSETYSKIPLEVIEICDYLEECGTDITVAVPYDIVCYVRQQNADVYMPYGRQVPEWEKLLEQDTPEVEKVMEEAGNHGCDYIVTKNTYEWSDAFEQLGYIAEYSTDNYLIYKVTGVYRERYTHNELRQISKITYLDEQDNPSSEKIGYVSVECKYDKKGRRICEMYLDEKGKPYVFPDGCGGKKLEYDSRNRVHRMIFIDLEGMPTNIEDGYAIEKYEYNQNGKILRKMYLDKNGVLTDNVYGYAYVEYAYDEMGEQISKEYYNVNGVLVE